MKLRGKKIYHTPVINQFTKIPNELFGIKMNHIDKLVLMRLYYYPPDFKLAYTRLANELAIGDTTIKDSWKRLKENGYIIENSEYYKINLNGTGNDPKDKGTGNGHQQDQGTLDGHREVREMDVLGSVSGRTIVQETTHNGTGDVPNEEEKTKEEKELNKNKEEPLVVEVGGVSSDVATQPFGVAPSSPPPTQLSDEKKKTVSKYTSNENERLVLLTYYNDYLKNNPKTELSFDLYEDILMLVMYGYEDYTNNWEITKWQEVINLLTSQDNIQLYNSHFNNYLKGILEKKSNLIEILKNLRQQLIDSNNNNIINPN